MWSNMLKTSGKSEFGGQTYFKVDIFGIFTLRGGHSLAALARTIEIENIP